MHLNNITLIIVTLIAQIYNFDISYNTIMIHTCTCTAAITQLGFVKLPKLYKDAIITRIHILKLIKLYNLHKHLDTMSQFINYNFHF